MAISAVNSIIVPNSLGVSSYGDYNFLLKTFKSIQTFMTFSSGSAFFTYSSKNIKSANAFFIFFGWSLVQFALILLTIVSAILFGYKEWLFPDQINLYIIVIGVLQWINYIATSLIQFGETKAESVFVQKMNFISSVTILLGNVSLYFFGILNLNTFIVINYVGSMVLIVSNFYYLVIKKRAIYFEKYDAVKIRGILKYFVGFCKPLVVYGIFGLFFNIFDRWILQLISGSVEQGYFSIAFRWTTFSMVFTTSVINVFWREISYAYGNDDIDKVRRLYLKSIKFLFFIASFIAFYLSFNCDLLIRTFLRQDYYGAIRITQIMAFLPVFYTINQLNTSFLYAVEKVKLYRNISIIFMILGVAFAYILVAPRNFAFPGFDLAAVGIAMKSISISMLTSVVTLLFVLKFLGVKYTHFLGYQLLVLLLFALLSTSLKLIISTLSTNEYVNFVFFTIVYVSLTVLVVYFKPEFIGLSKEELMNYKYQLISGIRNFIGKKDS